MKKNTGQALTFVVILAAIGTIVITGAVAVLFINNEISSKVVQAQLAYDIAESGIENAILRSLRDPAYAGETLSIGEGVVTATVSGSDPKTITAEGRVDNFSRKIEVIAGYVSNIFTITSWTEIP